MQGAVGAMLVVVADIDREDAFEVAAVDDQDPDGALAADCADPPLTNRRRLHQHAATPLPRKHPSQRGQNHPIS